jgi:hypothetical protein
MRSFKLFEELPCWPDLSVFRVLKALTNAFVGIGVRGDIEQTLIGLGVLDDGYCLAIHSENYGALALLKMFHKIAGRAAEGRQRLDVGCDVKHRLLQAPY